MLSTSPKESTGPKTNEVLLISGPIHYDFLLPLSNQTQSAFADLGDLNTSMMDPNAQWLLVGWGAQDFYTSVGSYRDISARAIWRGITGDASVMRIDTLGQLPHSLPFQKIALNDTEYAALLASIRRSFAATFPLPQPGFGATDAFYPARGRFHLGRTCNVWVGAMLRNAGLRFGVWTPVPWSIRLSHWLYQTP